MKFSDSVLWICFAVLLVMSSPGQVATSRLHGTVQDETGGVVPHARITAVHNQTQVRATTGTDAEGFFVFPSLQPGDYTLVAEAGGFRKAVLNRVAVNVAETVTQIIRLTVGEITESVTVEANALRVQTSEATVARVVDTRDIDVLPLVARAPITLAIYQPGVQVNSYDPTFSRVNGTRQGSNNTTLDGIDNNDAVVPRLGWLMVKNNNDSVAEFRIVTTGAAAEYGRNAGAQIELITRSGTNRWSGNLYEYLRNDKLHANDFFNNSAGVPRSKYVQNQFGGSLGGPLRKDKTFIFGNYQGSRTRQEMARNRTVLTPDARAGVFRWRPPQGSATQAFDIARNDPRGKGIDAQVAPILKLLPDPNNADIGDSLNTAGFRFNNPYRFDDDQLTIKVDHHPSERHRISARYSWGRGNITDAINGADAPFPGQPQGMQNAKPWGFVIGSSWTVSSRMVNEVRYGYQSAQTDFLRPARLDGPMVIANTWSDPLYTGFAQGRNAPVHQVTENLSLVRGRHTLKAGFVLRFTTTATYDDSGIYPNVTLDSGYAPVPASIGPAAGISSFDRGNFEDLYNDLLGRIGLVYQTFYSDLQQFQPAGVPRKRNYRFREYGFFTQDEWRITPRLVLNFGLRYDLFGVPTETQNLLGTLDKVALVDGVHQFDDLRIERSTRWYEGDHNNFAPRAGVVWDPVGNGKLALRGGYGIFYDRLIGATGLLVDAFTPGFAQTVPALPNLTPGADVRLADGIPLPARPSEVQLLLAPTRSTSIFLYRPGLRNGYVQAFHAGLQRELSRNMVLDAAYVGNRGVKLMMDLDYNQTRIYGDFLTAFQQIQAFRTLGTTVPASNTLVRLYGSPNAVISALGAGTFDQGLVGSAANAVDRSPAASQRYAAAGLTNFYLRNYPQFSQVITATNDGRSYYDSLQISLRRQTGPLRVSANYTWSKSIDNISVDGNGYTAPLDCYNVRGNRARSDTDRPHVFTYMASYTLPVGRGHRLAPDIPAWLDKAIGGWDVGSVGVWESGVTYSFLSGRATGPLYSYLNYSGDRNIGSVQRRGDGIWFLTPEESGRFSFPAAGELGSSGRNAFRAPRYFDLDLSLVKRFRLFETHTVSFRAEAYNLFNNANFSMPNTYLAYPPSFGKIGYTAGQPRIMQLALRYDF